MSAIGIAWSAPAAPRVVASPLLSGRLEYDDYRQGLVSLVVAYCSSVGLSEARVANLAGRDGRFFARIRAGKTCNVDTLLRVTQWFSDNWPDGLEWPEGVERPVPATGSAAA